MKHILITGATGYIGSKLAIKLASCGNIIHALCRPTSDTSCLQHKNIQLFEGYIEDKESIANAMKGCNSVYHLASYARVWTKNVQTYYDINVDGTSNVLSIAKQLDVEKVVVTSTAGVCRLSDDNINDTKNFTYYEITKFLAEKKVEYFIKEENMKIVIVSPTRVYGPGIHVESNVLTKIIKQYLNGKWYLNFGNGNTKGNYVFIDDIVDGHILAMEKGKKGSNYLLGGDNVSYNDIFYVLKRISKISYPLYKIPLSLMLLFAKSQQFMAELLNTKPLITPQWVRKYNTDVTLSSELAEKEIGYKIIPFDEGIIKTVNWLQHK